MGKRRRTPRKVVESSAKRSRAEASVPSSPLPSTSSGRRTPETPTKYKQPQRAPNALEQLFTPSPKKQRTPIKGKAFSPRKAASSVRRTDGIPSTAKGDSLKLFGHCIDLSAFTPDAPMYSLCRAWVGINSTSDKPRTRSLRRRAIKKRSKEFVYDDTLRYDEETSSDDSLSESDSQSNKRSIILPRPEPLPKGVHTLRVPSPLPHTVQEINLDYENRTLPTKEELLHEHMERWQAVRRKWMAAANANEDRYAKSKKILMQMFMRIGEFGDNG